SRCGDEQARCVAEIRLECQSRHVPTMKLSDSQTISAFWSMTGTLSADAVHQAFRVLVDLEPRFKGYIADRYVRDAATRLQCDLAAAPVDRLGHWMFRAIRHGDAATAAALSAVALQRRQVGPSLNRVARECGAAVARQLSTPAEIQR